MDVICIGQATLDVIVQDCRKGDIKPGELGYVDHVQISPGGDALNEASVLAGMGYDTELVIALGDDMAGNMIASELRRRKIDTRQLQMQEGKKSVIVNVLVDADAERSFLISRDLSVFANLDCLQALDVNAKVVTLGSLFMPPFLEVPQVLTLAEKIKGAGAILCADCSVNGLPFGYYEGLWKYVDYFFPNEQEARYFSGKDQVDEMAEYFLAQGISNIIIKLGAEGCYVKNKEQQFFQSAYLTNKLDTTGAGDSFEAGFIAGLLDKQPLGYCSKMACAAASIMVRHIGTSNVIKNKEQVLDLLEKF